MEPVDLLGYAASLVQVRDVLADTEYTWTEAQERTGFRTVLAVPLLRMSERANTNTPIGCPSRLLEDLQRFSPAATRHTPPESA